MTKEQFIQTINKAAYLHDLRINTLREYGVDVQLDIRYASCFDNSYKIINRLARNFQDKFNVIKDYINCRDNNGEFFFCLKKENGQLTDYSLSNSEQLYNYLISQYKLEENKNEK